MRDENIRKQNEKMDEAAPGAFGEAEETREAPAPPDIVIEN